MPRVGIEGEDYFKARDAAAAASASAATAGGSSSGS
jgi:hypothetical protein